MTARGYMAQIERLLREAKPPTGMIAIANVEHAADCAFLRNPRVACECGPAVTLALVDRGVA